MMNLQLYIGRAGYCWADEHHSIRGGAKKKIKFHATYAVIKHPKEGYILFDTAYTERFYKATAYFPAKIYAWATKVEIKKEEEVVAQLASVGIKAEEIKYIIISHFHADHVGGLKDFPKAQFICSQAAVKQLKRIPAFWSFSKGILKNHFPADFEDRLIKVEQCAKTKHPQLGNEYDLLGDGSILAYRLDGHAAGQIGIRLKTQERRYFLVADSSWHIKSIRELVLPHPIVKLFFHSWKDFKQSLHRLHSFYNAHPYEYMVPTHCDESVKPLLRDKIEWDAL